MRADNRGNNELRKITMNVGVCKNADGSCYIEFGKNKIIAAVYGPKELYPKHLQLPKKALVRCRYNLAPFSVQERARPGPSRRSVEISKVISELFDYVIFTEQFPRTCIDIFIEILNADAGTRCAGIVAASLALANAGIPMLDLISACAVGKVNNELVVDLTNEEDQKGQTDMAVAMLPRTKEILLLQMDGNFTKEDFEKSLQLATDACIQIYELQKKCLHDIYKVENAE